jgi:ankyrin repeat protein
LAHDRPFKCIIRACDFAEIGFTSEPALTRHMSDCHKHEPKSSANDSYSIDLDIKGFEVDLIADAIEAGEVDCVRDLLQQVPSDSLLHLISKAGGGSVEIMKLLLERISTTYSILPIPVIASLNQSLKMAMEANNVELVEVLLDYRKECAGLTAFACAFKIKSPPIIRLLLSADQYLRSCVVPESLFKEGRSPNDEPVIIECLQTLLESSAYRYVQKALELAVIWDSSIGIAEFLLENGATVDAISRKAGYTILHWAAKNTTATAAEMVRFLLRQGADPNVKKSGRLPGELPGAKNISKWLGLTWDELVESTRAERLAHSQQKDDGPLVFRQSKVE